MSADVIVHPVGTELVLLDMRTEQYIGLNASGLRIWKGLEAGRTDLEIEADLCATFPAIPADRLRDDLQRLLGKLQEHGLLRDIG